jgi:hypothetical protein
MKNLLLALTSGQQVKGDHVNSTLIRQNVKRIFNLKARLYWCSFIQKDEFSAQVDVFLVTSYHYNM